MLQPDKDRLRVQAVLNGWIMTKDTWNEEAQRWDDSQSWVYQDVEVLMSVLREQIAPVVSA